MSRDGDILIRGRPHEARRTPARPLSYSTSGGNIGPAVSNVLRRIRPANCGGAFAAAAAAAAARLGRRPQTTVSQTNAPADNKQIVSRPVRLNISQMKLSNATVYRRSRRASRAEQTQWAKIYVTPAHTHCVYVCVCARRARGICLDVSGAQWRSAGRRLITRVDVVARLRDLPLKHCCHWIALSVSHAATVPTAADNCRP